jgi:phosphate transport system permease protein
MTSPSSKSNATQVRPERPWKPSLAERLSNIGVAVAAIVASYLLVWLTPMKGLLPTLIWGGIFAIVFGYLKGFLARGTTAGKNNAVGVFLSLGMVVALIPIASILYSVISNGYKGLHRGLLFEDMSMNVATDPIADGGLKHAIIGTFIMVFVALVISLPLGILTAVYLTEIKGPLSKPIRFLVQAMSGVPSIVAGLFILSAVVYTITKSYSGFMGSLALTILMIPTIARTSEEVLLLIPNDLREAGVALGGTQWRTVAMVVVPAARSGLVTAMILGIARVAGETAPILLLTGGADMTNYNNFSGPMGTLPFYIWKSFFFGSPEAVTRGWAGLLVLLILVLILFFLARALSTRKVSR